MVNLASVGPSANAQWEDRQLEKGSGQLRPPTLRLLPDASNVLPGDPTATGRPGSPSTPPVALWAHALYYYLPLAPRLVRDSTSTPVFSLTLVLSQQPGPNDTLAPLIQQGQLACDLTLAVPQEVIAALGTSTTASPRPLQGSPPVAMPVTGDTTNIPTDYQPLFAHDALFRLESNGTALAGSTVSASGTNARVGFSVSLDRSQTLAVLSALDGGASGLTVACTVRYRTAVTDQTLRLSGSWAAIYDYLKDQGAENEIGATDLKSAVAAMVQAGTITVTQAQADGVEITLQNPDLDTLFPIFLRFSSIILDRTTPEFETTDAQNRYRLKLRPNPLFRLNVQQTTSAAALRTVELSAPLEQVIGGALDGLDRSAFIHLISPSTQATQNRPGLGPAPRLVRSRHSLGRSATDGRIRLAASNGAMRSLALTLRPTSSTAPSAQQLAASDTIISGSIGNDGVRRVAMDDVVLEKRMPPRDGGDGGGGIVFPPHPTPRPHPPAPTPVPDPVIQPIDPVVPTWSLPLVDDPAAALWQDRMNPALYWYAPFFVVLQPAPNQSPDSSPFLFTFVQSGATVTGKPGLNASVRFTLQVVIPDAMRTALQALNNPPVVPVPINTLSVALSLPFRDESGATRSQLFPATVHQVGNNITATVDLLDDWVRLCYGALSQPNFQTQPARLVVSYAFPGIVRLPPRVIEFAYGGKVALTPVAFSDAQAQTMGSKPFLHAVNATFVTPVSEMRFVREAPQSAPPVAPVAPAVPSAPPAMVRSNGGQAPALLARSAPASAASPKSLGGQKVQNYAVTPSEANPTGVRTVAKRGGGGDTGIDAGGPSRLSPVNAVETVSTPIQVQKLPVISRPDLESSTALANLIDQPHYANQTQLHQVSLDVLYPCNTLGAFYVQQSNGTIRAIGCQDALQLGQTKYKQYEEIQELAHPLYRVYRSLQQPGRFLVLSATYAITRFGPTETGKAYRPVIVVYSSVDAQNPANNRFLFDATLQADLPRFVRRELVSKLGAYASNPALDYPTGIESQLAYSWVIDHTLNVQPLVVKSWDGFQVTFATDVASALLFQNMLKTSGVAGSVTFTLPDGSTLQSNLSLDLRAMTGPWEGGPIAVTLQSGSGALLTNSIERDIAVSDLVLYQGVQYMSAGQQVQVDKTLAAGASLSVPFTVAASEAYAAYTIPPGDPASLKEVRSFVEDIHTNVIFLNLINYANHNLKQLSVQARLKDVEGTYTVPISEDPQIASLDLFLPLTTYLTQHVLQFQVTKKDTAGATTVTPWIDWDLTTQGTIVSLVWDMIK